MMKKENYGIEKLVLLSGLIGGIIFSIFMGKLFGLVLGFFLTIISMGLAMYIIEKRTSKIFKLVKGKRKSFSDI